MADKIEGYLEVGCNERDEVVINLDRDRTGHVVFSPNQARGLASLLLKHASLAADQAEEKRKASLPPPPPVDRSARVLTNGEPVSEDHREIDPITGMQKGYVVLTADERAKGFVRPVRRTYTHLKCGTPTTMANSIAETYARDPKFYSGTFCTGCGTHFPLVEFVWTGTSEQVGS